MHVSPPSPRRTAARVAELLRHGAAAVALSLLALADSAGAQARQAPRTAVRIAVFDSRVIFDSLPERVAAESEFALEQAKARTMLAAATDSLRAALDEFTRVEQHLTPRQREATALHLRARELLVEEMVASLDQLIVRRHGEIEAPMRERVRAAVRDVRVRDGYDLVFDMSTNNAIVDADARIDITSAILQQLRAAPKPVVSQVTRPR